MSIAKLRKPGFRAIGVQAKKAEFNVKWSFKVIQGHVFFIFGVSGKATRD